MTQPTIDQLRARLRALSGEFDAPPAPRPRDAASAKQLAFLTTLMSQQGVDAYRSAKSAVGVDAPLGRLTRREAWLIANHMTREDSNV